MRQLLFALILLMGLVPEDAAAQLAVPEVPGCLQVTKKLGKFFAAQELGKCPAICSGCGCNGGPGFRAPSRGDGKKGACVGFRDVNSVCGPPPHNGCKAECKPVIPECLGHGRAWFALNAKALNMELEWLPATEIVADDQSKDPDRVDGVEPPPKSPPAAGLADPMTLASTAVASRCGPKRTCREMTSCEEAKFYLKQCGLTGLDRTGNGVPCKSICGP